MWPRLRRSGPGELKHPLILEPEIVVISVRGCRKISVMKVIPNLAGRQPWGWSLRKSRSVGTLYA